LDVLRGCQIQQIEKKMLNDINGLLTKIPLLKIKIPLFCCTINFSQIFKFCFIIIPILLIYLSYSIINNMVIEFDRNCNSMKCFLPATFVISLSILIIIWAFFVFVFIYECIIKCIHLIKKE
jgi:hypothetical protein